MTLSELIEHVGNENVEFQNLMQGDLDLNAGKRDGSVTFHTSKEKVEDLMRGGRKFTVFVLWLPNDRMPKTEKG